MHLQAHFVHFLSSANASPIFEGRGGDDLAQELSKALERTFCTGAVDLSSLCVISGKCCWILYVDAVVRLYLSFARRFSCYLFIYLFVYLFIYWTLGWGEWALEPFARVLLTFHRCALFQRSAVLILYIDAVVRWSFARRFSYLSIYLVVYLFIYLFICLFNVRLGSSIIGFVPFHKSVIWHFFLLFLKPGVTSIIILEGKTKRYQQ